MIAVVLVLFFCMTSALHFYWAVGGRWGFKAVLPQNISGNFVIIPKAQDCLGVAIMLLVCATLYATKLGLYLPLSDSLLSIGFYAISIALTARTIGDFRYIGIFKRIKDTGFARRDSRYFTPLCLLMAILGLITIL